MELKYDKAVGFMSDYRCELTAELDVLAKLNTMECYDVFYHYILIDDHALRENCLPIRVPGGTVGGIWFDDSRVITKIFIDQDYVIETYTDNTNEVVQKYVGEKLEW